MGYIWRGDSVADNRGQNMNARNLLSCVTRGAQAAGSHRRTERAENLTNRNQHQPNPIESAHLNPILQLNPTS